MSETRPPRFAHGIGLAAAIPYIAVLVSFAGAFRTAQSEERAMLKFLLTIIAVVGYPLAVMFCMALVDRLTLSVASGSIPNLKLARLPVADIIAATPRLQAFVRKRDDRDGPMNGFERAAVVVASLRAWRSKSIRTQRA